MRKSRTGKTRFMQRLLSTKSRILLIVALVAFVFGAGLLIGGFVGRGLLMSAATELPTMKKCVDGRLPPVGNPAPALLQQLTEHCYSAIRSQGLLNDISIRNLNYVQQYQTHGVLLWMVVAITMAGVILAGVQLAASHQLAVARRKSLAAPNELTLRSDRIVLRSSVTGLVILVLSFAFFLIFVLYVYRFENLIEATAPKQQQSHELPLGTLGPPPSKKE